MGGAVIRVRGRAVSPGETLGQSCPLKALARHRPRNLQRAQVVSWASSFLIKDIMPSEPAKRISYVSLSSRLSHRTLLTLNIDARDANIARYQHPSARRVADVWTSLTRLQLKCSRTKPCQNCATAGQACEYREVDRKRRPATHEYVTSLEDRVAWLESFIGRLQAAPAQERDDLLQSMSFGDHLPARRPLASTSNPNSDKGQGGHYTRESIANLQVDLEGSLIYHGATSIYCAHSGRPTTGNDFGASSALSKHASASDTNFEYVAEHFGISLHDELVHDALLQFFKWQYPHFMFIYREAFLRDHFSDRVRCKYWSSALLLSVCALGTLMSPDKRHRESSAQFFSAAESILIVSGLTKPSIVTVQGFLCLAFYEIGRGNLSKGWGFSGTFSSSAAVVIVLTLLDKVLHFVWHRTLVFRETPSTGYLMIHRWPPKKILRSADASSGAAIHQTN